MKYHTSMALALTVVLSLVLEVYCGGVIIQGSGIPGAWYRFYGKRNLIRNARSNVLDVVDLYDPKRDKTRDTYSNIRSFTHKTRRSGQNHHQRAVELPFWRRELERATLEWKRAAHNDKKQKLERALADLQYYMENQSVYR